MKTFRILGDVHGKVKEYLDIVKDCDYSLQIGDMGFDYSHMKILDFYSHRFIMGNHDDYSQFPNILHNLGNYGEYNVSGFGKIFFVRGGFSIDWKQRTPGIDWWPEEELNYEQRAQAIEKYKKWKPDFVVSHECPLSLVSQITDGAVAKSWGYDDPIIQTVTNTMLQDMLDVHRPKTWVFGHYHRSFDKTIDGTRFICLAELEVLEYKLLNDTRIWQ